MTIKKLHFCHPLAKRLQSITKKRSALAETKILQELNAHSIDEQE